MRTEEIFRGRRAGIANLRDCDHYVLAVPLLEKGGEDHVLFEVRGAVSQPGDVCLPGGRAEEGEDLEEALRRELREELLIRDDQILVAGPADIYIADRQRALHPYLVRLRDYEGTFSRAEVAEVFTLPLAYFLTHRPRTYRVDLREEPEEDFPYERISGGRNYRWLKKSREVSFYDYEPHTIWGLTAKVMEETAALIREEAEKNPGTGDKDKIEKEGQDV